MGEMMISLNRESLTVRDDAYYHVHKPYTYTPSPLSSTHHDDDHHHPSLSHPLIII